MSNLYQQYSIEVTSTLLILVLLLLAVLLLSINIRKRHQVEKQLKELNLHLEEQVEKRTLALMEKNLALEDLSRQLEFYAHTDPLTQLGNRRSGSKHFNSTFQRQQLAPDSGINFAIALLDIDDFKAINDNYGHDQGDQALMAVASCLRDSIRPTDAVFRWGGEEFLLILHNVDTSEARASCERLREQVALLEIPDLPSVTASIGLRCYAGESSVDDMLKHADEALYLAKQQGKNQVVSG